jgi:hypothetical protein
MGVGGCGGALVFFEMYVQWAEKHIAKTKRWVREVRGDNEQNKNARKLEKKTKVEECKKKQITSACVQKGKQNIPTYLVGVRRKRKQK